MNYTRTDLHEESPFWIVWCDGGGVPTVKHLTVESARSEAERLARTNHGKRFHVLVALGNCSFNAVNWVQVDHDAIPS